MPLSADHAKYGRGLTFSAPHLLFELALAARQAWPAEACGLVWGDAVQLRATAGHVARNLARDPRQFVLDPRDLLAAAQKSGERGEEILAIWHSHPCAAAATERDAQPSAHDRREAWPGWLHLIGAVGPQGDVFWRCWRLAAGGQWVNVPLLTDPPGEVAA